MLIMADKGGSGSKENADIGCKGGGGYYPQLLTLADKGAKGYGY